MNDEFYIGAVAALEDFRGELIKSRGLIENDTEPVFDVILDLLGRVIKQLEDTAADVV